MPRKTRKQIRAERAKLLSDIKAGRKHTHRNDILAPLAAADLIKYDYPSNARHAQNVRLTESGEIHLSLLIEDGALD